MEKRNRVLFIFEGREIVFCVQIKEKLTYQMKLSWKILILSRGIMVISHQGWGGCGSPLPPPVPPLLISDHSLTSLS